jgi:general secretion pathway protein D
MKQLFLRSPVAAVLLGTLTLLLAAQGTAAPTPLQTADANTVQRLGKDRLTLNFANAELEAVVRTVTDMVGKTAVVDPRIKGTLNLQTDKPISRQQAYQLLLTQLRLAGYSAVDTGKVLRVVPEADGKLQGGAVSASPIINKRGDELLTQIFKLQFESAQTMLAVVRPLVAPNNVVTAAQGSNALIVTDYAENLQRINKLLTELDKPIAPQTEMIALRNANATDLASLLQRLQDNNTAVAGGQPAPRTTIVAELRSNSLLIKAPSNLALEQTKQLITRLDVAGERNGNVNIIHLKNADATKLAATLRAVLSGEQAAPAASTPASGPAGAASGAAGAGAGLSERSSIQADATTNTLIITASEPVFRNLRGIIDQLDVRRAQVYVETLIVEVSTEKAAEFGFQWMNGLSKAGNGSTRAFGGTTFSNNNGTTNILAASADPTAISGAGFVLGIANGVSTILGKPFLNLGALAQALEKDAQANILSTPNVTTLDNEEAKVIIGENVPFITGSYAQSGAAAGATTNPFQTIERKDVGLTLKVRPQVSESGTIKLAIYQEISNVKDKTLAQGIITSKRSIDTNVLVENGQVVVIGGLIEDSFSDGVDKVPVLGDLPFLGNLFKTQSRKRTKTNLMIFLRPIIVPDSRTGTALSQDRYEGMRSLQTQSQPHRSAVLPDMAAPILPAMPAGMPAVDAQGVIFPVSYPVIAPGETQYRRTGYELKPTMQLGTQPR